MKQIVTKYGTTSFNLKDLRLVTMCLICFAGFLRFSELVNLKRSNIKFYSDHVNLNIEKSKTDIYREGKDVIISATNNYICPVAMLSRYLLLANISEGSNDYTFLDLSVTVVNPKLIDYVKVVFYLILQLGKYCYLL